MGPQEDYIETVFTCEGDFHDPQLHSRLEKFRRSLKDLLLTDMHKLILKKVEPWNSVRVTFNIPKEAALRLKQLAQQGNAALRELGVLAVQIQGDHVVSLTIAGRNNERTELILRATDPGPGQPPVSVFEPGLPSSDEMNSPGPSNVEVTRKNIADYLRQGTALFSSMIHQPPGGVENGVFRSPNVVASSTEPIPFRPNSVINTSPSSTTGVSSQTGMFMSNLPPGKNMGGYPAGGGNRQSPPGPSHSPVFQPGHKFPTAPGMPPGIPPAPPVGNMNHIELPPPPPYPGGMTLNNIQRIGKTMSVSSPLLVNLLQTEPLVAGMNNLPGCQMLPPVEGGPTPKKRKKPRKKEKASSAASDGEIPIQSVLNPALDTTTVLPCDRNESSMDSSQSGHNLDVDVSMNPGQRLGQTSMSTVTSPMDTDNGSVPGRFESSSVKPVESPISMAQSSVSQLLTDKTHIHEQHDPFTPESTAGKIINPYTGQLEPMDRSPVKSVKPTGSATPVKNKAQHATVASKPKCENVFLARGKMHVNKISATVTSEDSSQAVGNMAGHVPINSDMFSFSDRTGEQSPQLGVGVSSASVSLSAAEVRVPQQIYAEASQSSQFTPTTVCVSTPLSSASVPSPTQSQSTFTVGVVNSEAPSVKFESAKLSLSRSHLTGSAFLDTSGKPRSQSAQQSVYGSAEVHSNTDCKSPFLSESVSAGPAEATVCVSENVKANAKADSPPLLNSPSTRTTESNCISSSPGKIPSEGDENSNHSGIINDITADIPTSAGPYLDSNNGKVYNHDSGVGSSSERSDDTPSEPGDSEFRSSHPAESEDVSKVQKVSDCKPETKQMTVGYVMDQDHMAQAQKEKHDLAHLPFTKEKMAALGHLKNHMNLLCGQVPSDIHPNNQVTVLQWSTKDGKPFAEHRHLANSELLINSRMGRLKNGPLLSDGTVQKDHERSSSSPESKNVTDVGHHVASKHIYSKELPSETDLQAGSPSSQPTMEKNSEQLIADTFRNGQKRKGYLSPGETLERTSSYQCNNSSPDWLNFPGLVSQSANSLCDIDANDSQELSQSFAQSVRSEPHSPSSLGQMFANSDNRYQPSSPKSAVDRFFPGIMDTEDVQGSAKGIVGKGDVYVPDGMSGSNITSKYSKRSSPVNVNMLNHIYAPGLPLPRRLTESIQRLVKPLGDPSLPQMRTCKSPGASGLKHSQGGDKSPRTPHGGRSPGGSSARSGAGGGVPPTSQAALASSMPSNLPNQNTMSGSSVSNFNTSLSNTVSSSCMTYESQSLSRVSVSSSQPSSQTESKFFSNSQQHSTHYGTYSPPPDSQSLDPLTASRSGVTGIVPIRHQQHQETIDSDMLSMQPPTDLADQLVPSCLSHKCNTRSGNLSQANQPYATPLSADMPDLCPPNLTYTQSDLVESAISHSRTERSTASETGSCPVLHSVNCVQSSEHETARESRHQNVNVSSNDGQHLSLHSTLHQSIYSVQGGDAAAGCTKGKAPALVCHSQSSESDNSLNEVPRLSPAIELRTNSTETVLDEAQLSVNTIDEAVPSYAESVVGQQSDSKVSDTLDLCSSEAATSISDSPTSINPSLMSDKEGSVLPSLKDVENKPVCDSSVANPNKEPVEIVQACNVKGEPKTIKKVAELLKTPATNVDSLEVDSCDSKIKGDPSGESKPSRSVQGVLAEEPSSVRQPPVLQPEPDALRRITRKRKSTHSESEGKENDADASGKSDVPELSRGATIDAVAPPKAELASGGPRTRETRRQVHGEEKLKVSEEVAADKVEKVPHADRQPKDVVQDKKDNNAKDDDQMGRRGSASRRNKSLPVAATEKAQQYCRTRSQSVPVSESKDPKAEKEKDESPNAQKRSTRSSRQKDHSEPAAKRRRSRDHR